MCAFQLRVKLGDGCRTHAHREAVAGDICSQVTSPAVVALATPARSTQNASPQWAAATSSAARAATSSERPLPAGPITTTRFVEMSCVCLCVFACTRE